MADSTEKITQLIAEGVHTRVYPGAVWATGNATGMTAGGTAGLLDPTEPDAPMRPDTVFDAASLTKILAVWSTIGALWEDGTLPLDEPLAGFWPEVAGHPLGQVTARQLLTHTAGLSLRAQLKNLYGTDPAAIRTGVLHEVLNRPPGEAVEYTDRAVAIPGEPTRRRSSGHGQPQDRRGPASRDDSPLRGAAAADRWSPHQGESLQRSPGQPRDHEPGSGRSSRVGRPHCGPRQGHPW